MSKLVCDRMRLTSATVLLAALVGCSSSTEPARPTTLTLRLTTDSAYVYGDGCAFGSFYCVVVVPSSGTMTERLIFGPETTHLSDPTCCSGIVGVFRDAEFADSLSGQAVIDLDSVTTVTVGPVPFTGYYDYFTLTGKLTDGQFSGRWWQEAGGPHGTGFVGSFITVP